MFLLAVHMNPEAHAQVSTTVRNEQIARLPLSGRDVLGVALLTPGTSTSSTNRFSTFNGLPGGAINITLDGIHNNSQRFRSGGTRRRALHKVEAVPVRATCSCGWWWGVDDLRI